MKQWFTLFVLMLIPLMSQAYSDAPALPNQSETWLNKNTLSWSDLRGKVVLLNVWTFGCWNSYRSLSWVVALQKKHPELQIIGVHTPEFSWEKDRDRMRKEMEKYGVTYPQVLDDDFKYWKALGNRYWPSFYLVDKQGKIRGNFSGETHAGDAQAKRIEAMISELKSE